MTSERIDLARSKRRNSLLIIISLLALTALYLFSDGEEEIVVTKIDWHTDRKTCQVTYTLKNRRADQLWTNLTIRAIRIEKQGVTLRSQIVGERNQAVVLKPGESRTFECALPVSGPPDRVTVKIWQKPAEPPRAN